MKPDDLLDNEVKICPECSETIKLRAKKCRYCQTTFDPDDVEKQIEIRYAELIFQNTKIEKQSPNISISGDHLTEIINDNSSDKLNFEQFPEITGNNSSKKSEKRKPTKTRTFFYYVFLFMMAVATLGYIILPRKPVDSFYLSLWIGITGAWTAKRKGKSSWLGFLIGFVVVGFSIVIIVNAFDSFQAAKTSPFRTELQQMEPIFKNASLRKLQSALNRLDEIDDISTLPNIKKATQIIEFCIAEISKVEIGFNKLIEFVDKYKDEILDDKKISILIALIDMNEQAEAFKYLMETKDFLNAYKKMLLYLRANFDNISNGKEPEITEYSTLFESYEIAYKKMNDAFFKKEKAIKFYLEKHPELLDYLKQAQKQLDNASTSSVQ